jgi:phosphatidylglycerol:prolipoprotein diacylglycerol transferase
MQDYLQTIDPFAIQFTESFGIRWYGLAYLAGFYIAYLLVVWLSKKGLSSVSQSLASDFIFNAAVGCLVGGRLGYVLFYSPHLFFDFRNSFPFWGALAINEGGMASHGGMIGIIIACYLFARKYKIQTLHLIDLCAFTGTIGVFFGRIANFINGELVGRIASPDAWFKVKFPQDILMWQEYEPSRLSSLSSVVELLNVPAAKWLSVVEQNSYNLDSRNFIHSVLQKIITQVQTGNTAVSETLAPLLDSRYPSQLFAAGLEGLFLFALLFFAWRKPRPIGFITSLFLIGYSIVRVFGEFYRLPDAHIGYQIFHLTRGQILSFGVFAAGVVLMIVVRNQNKMGGWSKLVNRTAN